MRNINTEALNKITQKLGTEPIAIVEVFWGDGSSLYADRDIGDSVKGRILELSDLDNVVGVSENTSSQEISITLDDIDGELKAIMDTTDIHKKNVVVSQWFDGLDLEDRFTIFSGKISSPITWSERDRTLSFNVVSQLEDKEVGFSAEEGDFDFIPDVIIGKTWPSIFGKVMDVPALRFTDAIKGTNLCGVGIISGSYYNTATQQNIIGTTTEDQSIYVSAAQMRAQISHLNLVKGAYEEAASATGYSGYRQKASELLDQINDIQEQMDTMFNQYAQQQACQTARQNQANDDTTTYKLGCNPVQILGGEDFPRGEIWIDIGGGHFRGRFGETDDTKDIFTISDRYHEEDYEAWQEEVSDASSQQIPECQQQTPPSANWNYQTNVPHGFGDNGTDLITSRGYTYVSQASSSNDTETIITPKQFWADAGSSVTLVKDTPIEYIVSITPGMVLAVKAYKTISGQRVLANVPSEYWMQGTKTYGPITAVTVEIDRTLSNIKDQGWEDDIYVTFESEIGPNTVDIMKYLIDTYSDLTYDETSFSYVREKLEIYPANFALLERKNIVEVLQEISFQARCALYIKDFVFYLKYLPEEPTADDTITLSDIDSENSVVTELTPTEDLVTKMRINWKLNYSEDGESVDYPYGTTSKNMASKSRSLISISITNRISFSKWQPSG